MQIRSDPLASFRDQFHLPENIIYLDGNSLGAMVKTVPDVMDKAVRREWADGLIRSWNDAGWWMLATQLGDKIAPLVGAQTGCVVVTDSTSINLYKALHAALSLQPDRKTIIAEQGAFPTDIYMSGSLGPDIKLRLIGRDGSLDELLDDSVAAVLLSHVDYRTGQLLHMKNLTSQIQAAGALSIWDLCHSAGVVPVKLDDCNVDFAVGCTYKYLNGGPGSPAFIYANPTHLGNISQPLSGWWSHAEPFTFKTEFQADSGIRAFLCGTQPILSMRALEAALAVFGNIDMSAVRQKSKALTSLFAELVLQSCQQYGVELFGPQSADERGSQVSFTHENAFEVMQALISRGVIGDFRQPNILRFGFSPLYINYDDVRNAAKILSDILQTGVFKEKRFSKRSAVT